MLAGAGLDVESIQLGKRGIVYFCFLFWFALHKELLCFSHQTLPGRKTLYCDTHPVVSDVVRPPCFTAVVEYNNGPFDWIHRAFECCFLSTFKRFTSHFRRLYGLRSRLLLTSAQVATQMTKSGGSPLSKWGTGSAMKFPTWALTKNWPPKRSIKTTFFTKSHS
jgi:hypothetical protein